MAQAFYRRYRPQTFEEVIGQKHVAETLRNALRQERIGHAYLLTGPRGTGKTSTARILAKAVNCQAKDVDARPDNSCPICVAINEGRLLDLIEIDAASNTSVDDVRELRDRVAFAPSEADYKVYVIDEVHMLSTSAFNALLKTLEEPPAHVIFILATTEPHKIPATVLSRCQRFDFHRISTRDITAHLDEIADLEGVQITPEGLGIIARSATGSMRDAISLLDQITAYGHVEVNAELVRDVLGMVSGAAVSDLIDVIASGDAANVLNQLHKLIGEGVELSQLVSQMIEHLRILLLLNVGKDTSLVDLPDSMLAEAQRQADLFQSTQLLHAIRVLNEAGMALKTPFAGYLPLELALLDTVGLGEVVSVSAPVEVEKRTTAKPAVPLMTPAAKDSAPDQRAAAAMEPGEDIQQQWNRIIQVIRKHSPRAQAMLRSGAPQGVIEDAFVISFRHDFHREQVEGSIDVVTEVVSSVLGRPISVRLVSDDYEPSWPATAVTRSPQTNPTPSLAPAIEAQSEPSPPSLTEDPVVRKAVDEYGAKITRVDSNELP